MSKFTGRQVQVGLATEAGDRAEGAAGATLWVPKATLTFDDKISQVVSQASLGVLADAEDALIAETMAVGDLGAPLRSKYIGYLLYSLLGTLDTSGPTDSAYTHAFTVAEDIAHQSLAMFVKDVNDTEQYKLSVVNTLEFIATLEDTVNITANIKSKAGDPHTALTPVYTALGSLFSKKHTKVKIAANIASLATASVLSIKSLRLTINGFAVEDSALGTSEPESAA